MKKFIISFIAVFTVLCGSIGYISAKSYTSAETFTIKNFGAWSERSKNSSTKNKKCSYGYMQATSDITTFSKYGDFVKKGTNTRVTKSSYKLHVNNETHMNYTAKNADNKNLTVQARARGEQFEPSNGSIIRAKFSANN